MRKSDDLRAIKALAKESRISQAEAIRRAVRAYISAHPAPGSEHPAFGLWAGRTDGLRYQQALRAEWGE